MKLNLLKNQMEKWWDYPVIKDWDKYPPAFEYRDSGSYVKIHVLQQDGIWCSGYRYWIDGDGFGGGCAPGRKWGEWDNHDEALTDTLEQILKRLEYEAENNPSGAVRSRSARAAKALKEKLILIREGEQLVLF